MTVYACLYCANNSFSAVVFSLLDCLILELSVPPPWFFPLQVQTCWKAYQMSAASIRAPSYAACLMFCVWLDVFIV